MQGGWCTTFLCGSCQLLSSPPGESWSFCPSHGGPTPVLANKVLWHGAPRRDPVKVKVVSTDAAFVDHCAARVEVGEGAVDIVVFSFHSSNHPDPFDHIHAGIGAHSPAFVLVLTCWATEQTEALRRLVLQHPLTTFVAFRDPQLRRFERFDTALPFLANSVLHPRSQPLVFLAQLSSLLPDTLVFAHCGAERAHLCGPLQVAESGGLIPQCVGCGGEYTSKRQRKSVRGVRRRLCRSTPSCADLLVSSRPPTSAAKSSW
jgi:hypothetical protein